MATALIGLVAYITVVHLVAMIELKEHPPVHPRWQKILKSEFQVTIPYISDHNGNYLSHDISSIYHDDINAIYTASTTNKVLNSEAGSQETSQHNNGAGSQITTNKPSLSSASPDQSFASSEIRYLHLRVNTTFKLFHLQLEPNKGLLASGFKVYRRKSNGDGNSPGERYTVADEDVGLGLERQCMYRGVVRGLESSSVALSMCSGMMGYIHTGEEHFIIEPLPEDVMLVKPITDIIGNSNMNNHYNHLNNITPMSKQSHLFNTELYNSYGNNTMSVSTSYSTIMRDNNQSLTSSTSRLNHQIPSKLHSQYSANGNNQENENNNHQYPQYHSQENSNQEEISNLLKGMHHIIYKHEWHPQSYGLNRNAAQSGHHSCGHDQDNNDTPENVPIINSDINNNPFLFTDDDQNIDIANAEATENSYKSSHKRTSQKLKQQQYQDNRQEIHQRLKRDTHHSAASKSHRNRHHNGHRHHHSSALKGSSKNASASNNKDHGHSESIETRSVETIVVVDHDMLTAHGEANVTTYVLTLLNMVNTLFHDNTIGTKINISLVGLILLEGDEPGLVVENQADQALNNFCHWQSNLKGLHHDHAILLTGVDICSFDGQFCDTLGFAPIEGMCKRYRSCTLNEDNGLGTAFTITHEAGHNFGMRHDGDDNYCTDYSGSIMAPRLLGTTGTFKWSACSRKYLDRFLNSDKSWCLQNTPAQVSSLQFPDKLPGELYDADIQCKWQFGTPSRLCTYDFAVDLCKALWCYTGGLKCETKFLPSAEGTSCGHSKWCRKGMCVSYGDEGPSPIDGRWSGWSPWSSCSRSCGGGIMYRQRSCNRPRPQYGGKDCDGDQRIHKLCNRQACPQGMVDSRAEQCAFYNNKAFRGLRYEWIPYTHIYIAEDQCKLYCKAFDRQLYFEMSHKVEDGTSCLLDPGGVCIDGECQYIGCDNMVGSHAKLDICGVCGGDNTTCEVIRGQFTHKFKQNKYNYLMTLPEGSRSIMIKEASLSPSYFAIRTSARSYYLNGDWRISWPGEKLMAGTKFMYKRSYNQPEEVTAKGPTDRDLIIEVLALRESPVVKYEYTVPKRIDYITVTEPPHNFTWSVSVSDCSAKCATGQKVVTARCLKNHREEVDSEHCNVTDKPYTGVIPCNPHPCPPRWIAQDWGNCTKTCGGGIQRRKVVCLQTVSTNETVRVRNHQCSSLQKKPQRRRVCNVQECPPEWHTGQWTECSVSCDQGSKHRQVACRNRHQKLPEHYCSHAAKPENSAECKEQPCFTDIQWYMSAWAECSTSCGPGLRTRIMRCSGKNSAGHFEVRPAEECINLEKPLLPLQENCEEKSCSSTTKWFMSPWSQCSASCGTGTQIRLIRCMESTTGKLTTGCDESNKPETTRDCEADTLCDKSDNKECTDAWSMCHLVPIHNLCKHHYYGEQCCKSCSQATLPPPMQPSTMQTSTVQQSTVQPSTMQPSTMPENSTESTAVYDEP